MKSVTLQDYKRRILKVLVHVQQNLDEPFALDALAALACFSPYHFHRVFRGMVGESVHGHIRRLRLERAASRLKLSAHPVIQIALDAGFETHEAFTRAFHAMFGLAPSAYRARARPKPALPAPSGVHYRDGQMPVRFKAKPFEGLFMKVDLKTISSTRVAFMRHVGPYSNVGATWDKLLPILGKEGLLGGDTLIIGICHDDPEVTPTDHIRYDAAVSVDEQFQPQGEIGVQTLAGGEYAVTTHFGPYDQLGKTYAKLLGQWLPRSGRELRSSPCFEVYLNDPHSTDPKDLLTDVYAPLKRRH